EKIFPASDLSEQISTAGTEASGTGCMKFMMNGALTIGTYDGANIEIAEAVGEDNIFVFGRRVEELKNMAGSYNPREFIERSPVLSEIMRLIKNNFFSTAEPGIFDPIWDSIENADRFFVAADFDAYLAMQENVSRLYSDRKKWTEKSILNVARSGRFSSDRTVAQYADDIWKVKHSVLSHSQKR
ncbi:MAG: glycogen/starch/alpha-glucan phosphorylase, partial [Candidatus Omnitrophota bacterium]